jgi:hypothetical protein
MAQANRKRLVKLDTDKADDGGLAATDYLDYFAAENGETTVLRAQTNAAVKIQQIWRRKLALRFVDRLKHKIYSVTRVQTCFRRYQGQKYYITYQKELRAAKLVQKGALGLQGRKRFNALHAGLSYRRQCLFAAFAAQRVWKGHRARMQCARLRAMRDGPSCYAEWLPVIAHSSARRTYGAWTEMWLNGVGNHTWERVISVTFFENRVTKSCQWDKPPELLQVGGPLTV